MGILSDLMHQGINMGMGYGMNKLYNAIPDWVNQSVGVGTSTDRAMPYTSTDRAPALGQGDQSPALGSSGLGGLDPLSKLALKNMMSSGIGGMMPQQSSPGLVSTGIGGILQSLPMILSML